MVPYPGRPRPFPPSSPHRAIATASAVAVAGSLTAVGALVGAGVVLPERGWGQLAALTVLCGLPSAMVALRRIRGRPDHPLAAVPAGLLDRRLYGRADAIGDSEGRPLRPIGATATDIAIRTSSLLGRLVEHPGVRVFHGVRARNPTTPLIAHAVSAGRTLVLVESVAWPTGVYRARGDGRIECDGLYIGQSVEPLLDEVRLWRQLLPRGHQVSALVVVHEVDGADPTLPVAGPDLDWVRAGRAQAALRERVGHQRVDDPRTVAALIAATTP
jgi:hypothetical protein